MTFLRRFFTRGENGGQKPANTPTERTRLAFIDHSFHSKSNATSFLLRLLEKSYDVDIFWDESWNGGPKVDLEDISRRNYDTILLFQQIHYSEGELEHIAGQNLVLVPMFDASREFPDEFWGRFTGTKVINFSRLFHNKLEQLGLMSKYFQYFPPSLDRSQPVEHSAKLTGFFWQRTDQITWNHIRELIKDSDFDNIHIHGAVDPPGYPLVLPLEDEMKRYHVTLSKWFSQKDGYTKCVERSTVFFAPRLFEGIGMGFLEAMSMGKCVVAPDNPTMNEYIVHGETGLLYDPDNLAPLDFSQVEVIGKRAAEYMKNGYEKWLDSKTRLIDFVQG